ncbi:hypothetical protein KSS87_013521, partial [Heliosperma pusillum]
LNSLPPSSLNSGASNSELTITPIVIATIARGLSEFQPRRSCRLSNKHSHSSKVYIIVTQLNTNDKEREKFGMDTQISCSILSKAHNIELLVLF